MRLGDGEWGCILGTRDSTISGRQPFTPDLRAAMADVVKNAHGGNCYLSINPRAKVLRGMMPQIRGYVAKHAPDTVWHWGKLWHQASLDGRIGDIVRALRHQRIVIVGPHWLRDLPFVDEFIEVPTRHAWDAYDAIYAQVAQVRDAAICISAGVPSRVLVHQLYPEIGDHSWLLDLGTLWDPYCGRKSRTLWRGHTFDPRQLETG